MYTEAGQVTDNGLRFRSVLNLNLMHQQQLLLLMKKGKKVWIL